jgi:hypothetical protein
VTRVVLILDSKVLASTYSRSSQVLVLLGFVCSNKVLAPCYSRGSQVLVLALALAQIFDSFFPSQVHCFSKMLFPFREIIIFQKIISCSQVYYCFRGVITLRSYMSRESVCGVFISSVSGCELDRA